MKETKKHTKHTALTKPLGGEYHLNEWAFIGAPCDIINNYVRQIAKILSADLKVGYLDASHNEVPQEHPYHVYYQDRISYGHIETKTALAQKQNKKHFSSLDLMLVNGNHFIGSKQVVFINETKKASLERKLDRLTDIRIIVIEDRDSSLYDFLKPIITPKVQIFRMSDIKLVAAAIRDDNETYLPQLNGLVLAGGKSQRMGKDKGGLNYHGKAQREYEADLISKYCNDVFISYSETQTEIPASPYKVIKDTFTGLGPYGAILSAFRAYPNQAWLTIACDLPLLTNESIAILIQNRNTSKLATCFHNPETKFPEPLITIWEPRAYPVLLEFLSQGYSCPRKVLINTDIEEIEVSETAFMQNVNDPTAYEEVMKKIKSSN